MQQLKVLVHQVILFSSCHQKSRRRWRKPSRLKRLSRPSRGLSSSWCVTFLLSSTSKLQNPVWDIFTYQICAMLIKLHTRARNRKSPCVCLCFSFFLSVSQYSDENMMQPYNLAVCFGPSLLRGMDSDDAVARQPQVNDLVKTMILQHDSIFPSQLELPGPVYEKHMTLEQEYWWEEYSLIKMLFLLQKDNNSKFLTDSNFSEHNAK